MPARKNYQEDLKNRLAKIQMDSISERVQRIEQYLSIHPTLIDNPVSKNFDPNYAVRPAHKFKKSMALIIKEQAKELSIAPIDLDSPHLKRIAGLLGEAYMQGEDEARQMLEERAQEINKVPKYIRQAVKMLSKKVAEYDRGIEDGEIVEPDNRSIGQ